MKNVQTDGAAEVAGTAGPGANGVDCFVNGSWSRQVRSQPRFPGTTIIVPGQCELTTVPFLNDEDAAIPVRFQVIVG